MTNQQIRLQFGEMTASEMRLVKAVLGWRERAEAGILRENKALREMIKELWKDATDESIEATLKEYLQ